jgi:CheY-like chemotaxis protein
MTLVPPGTLVLVIDDDIEVRQSIADLLIMEGYEVNAVPSADAAWSVLTLGAHPALIVLDLWIPGMSSRELVTRLRASRHAAIPVLVLSGTRSKGDIEFDADAVTQKPIEATTLIRLVDKLARIAPSPSESFRRPPRPSPRQKRLGVARRRSTR